MIIGLDRARHHVIDTAISRGHTAEFGALVAEKLLARLGEYDFIRIYGYNSLHGVEFDSKFIPTVNDSGETIVRPVFAKL